MALINLAATLVKKSKTLQLIILRPLLSTSTSTSYCFSSSSATQPSLLHPPSETHLPKHHFSSSKPSLDQTLHQQRGFEVDLHDGAFNPNGPIGDSSFLSILSQAKELSSEEEALSLLDESGVRPTEGLVCSAIWAVRDDWELALFVFNWGDRWRCNSSKAWDLMIWTLGKQREFGIAWRLVRRMVQLSTVDPRRAMLIMIDSYAAANNPEKAIRTFQAMEKFRVTHDSTAFYSLLHSLCKYGDVEVAEEFMLANKNIFPLETRSFNIILNGWCNISLDAMEAKRIWREMSSRCVTPDAITYTHMISCFSKVGNLFDSLRLYDEMKKRGWVPGLGVYNSLVYVLTQENCSKEAIKILDKIKEVGLQPDTTTYNSIILPLCKAQKLEEAYAILANMRREGLDPTIVTFHAFVEVESLDGTLDLLNKMKEDGPGPNGDTFLLIINKFLKLKQPENTLRMWMEMSKYDVVPDSSHYSALVGGFVACGWVTKARELYDEMLSKGFLDDPKLEKLLKEPVRSNREGKGNPNKKNIQACHRKKTA